MGEPGFFVTGDRAGGRSWCLRRVGMSAGWLLLEDGCEGCYELDWSNRKV
ncbi:RNF8 isoform 2 [Pan troglodytes]|uniref:Ring finger protein 8 n=3 Tax=Hominidae TaxID=9604 RepID=F8WDH8_HUMAN|nr:ring finger protein 8 [Homo sapiens]KAI4018138.1 ring finger protein 8 [Homo sapiens]PNI77114.1 RNF8 isoform 2 [Pan troglodytes]PNJ88896.1 RNF8 isoform 2 [Pongo abelii]